MPLVIQIYITLKQLELVNTLEEYSTQWLNKHKTTASYLIHKKRDLSFSSKLSCIKNIKNKINEIENGNTLVKSLHNQTLSNLRILINQIQNTIHNEFNIELII
jgi:hypothetical protein